MRLRSATVAGMVLVPVLCAGLLLGLVFNANTVARPPTAPKVIEFSESSTANYLLGALADIRGEVPTAATAYLRALASDPSNMALRHRVFELSLLNGDTDTALRLARTLPEIEQDTLTRLVQGVALAKAGQVDKARAMLKKAGKQAPGLLQFQVLEGYLDTARGVKPEVVEKHIRRSKTAAAMAAWRDYHLARIWLKAGNAPKAQKLLESAHQINPQGIMATLLLAEVMAGQGQSTAAQTLLNDYRDANPAVSLLVPSVVSGTLPASVGQTLDDDMAATLFDFGLLLWGEGALTPARQLMNMAVGLAPNNTYYRFYTGMLLELGGDLTTAAQVYRPLVAPSQPEGVRLLTQIRLSEMQARQGLVEDAATTLRALARNYQNVPALHRSLAQVAFTQKDYKTAGTHYTWLLTHMAPGTPSAARAEVLFALGAVYERQGDIAAASRTLMEALALDRTNPQLLNYLGYMWVEHGQRLEDAFALLRKAHLLAPDDGAITDSLGWAYHMRGQNDVALEYLSKAVEQDPSSPEIIDHLGDVYAALNRPEDARRQWQRALDVIESGAPVPSTTFLKTVRKKLR